MMDWMTLCIEGVGLVILLIWIVIPIREFHAIFKRLKQQKAEQSARREEEI